MNIFRESFDKALQILTDGNSVKSNYFSNRVCLSIPKTNTYRDAFNVKEELQSFKSKLIEEFNRLTQAFFGEINSLKSDVLTTEAPTDKNTFYISLLREETQCLRGKKSSKKVDNESNN